MNSQVISAAAATNSILPRFEIDPGWGCDPSAEERARRAVRHYQVKLSQEGAHYIENLRNVDRLDLLGEMLSFIAANTHKLQPLVELEVHKSLARLLQKGQGIPELAELVGDKDSTLSSALMIMHENAGRCSSLSYTPQQKEQWLEKGLWIEHGAWRNRDICLRDVFKFRVVRPSDRPAKVSTPEVS